VLSERPSVFMSFPKEPHYFSEGMPNLRYVTSRDGYLKLFENAGKVIVRAAEASVCYLYFEVAVVIFINSTLIRGS
jgi:hypothetical protein